MNILKSLAAAALAALSVSAVAAPGPVTVCLDDAAGGFSTATAVCATDGGANDLSPLTGAVSLVSSLGSFILTSELGLAQPLLLSGLHFDGAALSFGSGSVIMAISQANLTNANGPTVFSTSFGGALTSGGSLSYSVWVDDNNALFGQGTQVANLSGFGHATGVADLSGEYSLSAFATLTHPNGLGLASSFNAATAVPEPSVLALLGLGLAGLGASSRRNRKS